MNLPFSLRQKLKIASFLFFIMACTFMIRLLEDKSLKKMDNAFSSIYNDRLVPATDLFQISEQVYAKRHLLEAHIGADHSENIEFPKGKLNIMNEKIGGLLKKYEQTYLIENEKTGLQILKSRLTVLRDMEKAVIVKNCVVDDATHNKLQNLYTEVALKIADLTKIQSKVGAELVKNTQEIMLGTKLYAALQFALAIAIGLLIIAILRTSNFLNVSPKSFSLN